MDYLFSGLRAYQFKRHGILMYSKEAYQSETKTFQSNLEKKLEACQKEL